MNNLYGHESSIILGFPLAQVVSRLDTLLLILKSCQGRICIEPWKDLHPDGSVHTLRDALSTEHDAVYQSTPAIAFDRCENGYILDAEGPQAEWWYYSPQGLSWETWT